MLQKFGFSQYESQVYQTLVTSEEPMDATHIVTYSGVPKAKVYEVLSRMIEKGMILDTVSEKKKLYSALPLSIAIKKLTKEFEANIQALQAAKPKRTIADDRVWSLKNGASIHAQCKQMIAEASESIFISAWHDTFADYVPLLEEKERQGIAVTALVVGEMEADLANVHVLLPADEHHKLEQFQLIIVDEKTGLFAGGEHGRWQAMKTMSPPFVKFFIEFFFHDLALAKIAEKYGDQFMRDEEIPSILLRLRY
ncbi:TrmB family transcriptional regulator [Aneurinibacillus sp. REN35]|uniref:TrmB family transcriptional regulator n=1 Tax=Aneurinibacillus sp. REN35 TaxID=3237286 RepID=UPI003527FC1D